MAQRVKGAGAGKARPQRSVEIVVLVQGLATRPVNGAADRNAIWMSGLVLFVLMPLRASQKACHHTSKSAIWRERRERGAALSRRCVLGAAGAGPSVLAAVL